MTSIDSSKNNPIRPLACVILAAGQGTRMRSSLPKVLHPLAGLSMVQHVIRACQTLGSDKIVIVIPPGSGEISQAVEPHKTVVQEKSLGTGDAVKAAAPLLKDFEGDVIVLFGDTPLVTPLALHSLREKRKKENASLVVAGFTPEDPSHYGRLVLDEKNELQNIVEATDATPEQKQITLCNGGIMLFDSQTLWPMLDEIHNYNIKGEYYLTDAVGIIRRKNLVCAVDEMDAENVLGVNTRVELAQAEKIIQSRLRNKAMLAGVTMTDPDTVFMSMDTEMGRDVKLGAHVVFGDNVIVEDEVEIKSFSYLEDVHITKGSIVGPFASSNSD